MAKDVLLLNTSEEVLNVVSWKRAVKLYCSGKAIKPYGYEKYHKVKTSVGYFDLPTALVLVEYVRILYKSAVLSRRNIMKRDQNQCQYCDIDLDVHTESIDHVVPRSRGGKHMWENVVACCKKCNTKKADLTLQESGMKLKRKPFVPTKNILILTVVNKKMNSDWSRWL